ncbi:aromatic-ring-hydroxylating dioxygenase subunit beta [Brevundimonas vesicularis]|uniref:aromatic-ring-hydroxylating dioxygenase subunit beta n=1 Tax=Brevundimonas vesicularis TaxID=41276 RepID=UPI0038D469DD
MSITRDEIRDLYDAYYGALDDVDLDAWPEYFTEDCLYRVIPRENFEAGYTLCTMQAESRGMLKDRVTGLTRTQMYAPRYYRRFPTAPRLIGEEDGVASVRHNLLVVQTLIDKSSDIVLSAVCHDKIVRDGDRLRFVERIVVFDSEMIPNSLVYPA